jgi:hypothetical protein
MHYQNGREAKNGDKVVQYNSVSGEPVAVGTLMEAQPGNDLCNGMLLVTGQQGPLAGAALTVYACLADCLHIEDAEKHPRPAGK